ncbi:hypothetical protein FIBSPDRAFT_712162, partial [Athelia psychrophila]
HRRLGHANVGALVDMVDSEMVEGMHVDLSSKPAKCEHCILGKQTRNPVPKIREGIKAGEVLERVHIDLTGPQAVTSANGHLYIMNIIDD